MHQALQKLKGFEKHPPICQEEFKEEGYSLRLRTVDLAKDLEIFIGWTEDPRIQVNWRLQENRQRLDKHYLFFTESEDRQSFLIEKSGSPLFQFDIFLIQNHELYYRIPTTTGDCILNYIILRKDESLADLKKAVAMQLDYFFSFPECRRLWMPVPEDQSDLKVIFAESGFRYRASYTSMQKRYDLFYLKRADYLAPRNPEPPVPGRP